MSKKIESYIFYDVLKKVLRLSENPGRFAKNLSGQLQEITGAQLVIISYKNMPSGENQILHISPERKNFYKNNKIVLNVADEINKLQAAKLFTSNVEDKNFRNLFIELDATNLIAIPLRTGENSLGSILLINLFDTENSDKVIDLFNRLSGVFALIIRNSVLFEKLEDNIAQRTVKLKEQNDKLLINKQELKLANEEFEAINEELMESLSKIKTINRELERQKIKAEHSDKLKTAFLHNISHEIRTPMNAIMGFTSMLKKNLSDDKKEEIIDIIQTSSHQLLTTVNDILTISSIETGQLEFYDNKIILQELFNELSAIYKPEAAKKGLEIKFTDLRKNKQEIHSDKFKLETILKNLIANAIKFTQKGSITVSTQLEEPNILKFTIKDTGIGISHAFYDLIFERFFQVETELHKKYGGTGLGLSIVKAYVEFLGGQITVDSKKNSGTVFSFTLPYKHAEQNEQNKLITMNPKELLILVAEDELFNFYYIREILDALGHSYEHVTDGLQAIEACDKNKFDLILMDIKMPKLDGYLAAKKIREKHPKIPIIAQTAYALEHEIKKYIDAFDGYVTKPINEQLLTKEIKKHLNL